MPMLVSVANWLRWRRLAKASPTAVVLTQGSNAAETPKYCNRPSTALIKAAVSQALGASSARRT